MINYICDKTRKACFVTHKKCKTIGRPHVRMALQLFGSYVFPVLEYVGDIWCNGIECKELESIQMRYLKLMLDV